MLGLPVDARSDLYSVGVVLFELLAGEPPFSDPDPLALVRMHAWAKVPTLCERRPDRNFAPQLEQLIADALAKRPELRFKSAGDMIAAIDAATCAMDDDVAVPREPPAHDLFAAEAAAVSRTHAPAPLPIRPGPFAPPMPASHARPASRPWTARARAASRRVVRWSKARWNGPHRRVVRWTLAGIGGLLVIGAIAAVFPGNQVAASAGAGDARPDAIPRLEEANGHVGRARSELQRGRRLEALGAFERALSLAPQLARDLEIREDVTTIAGARDSIAAVIALELLATQIEPPGRDVIVAQASTGKILEVRHRAVAIAERDGFAHEIDRVDSWSLDLKQTTTCEDRSAMIQKLRTTDRRAIPALRRARQITCVAREAAEAIAHLEARAPTRSTP
jgi:hypothetical protein